MRLYNLISGSKAEKVTGFWQLLSKIVEILFLDVANKRNNFIFFVITDLVVSIRTKKFP